MEIDFYNEGDVIDNRFRVLETLGGGGFGKVVKVLDLFEGNEVALKYCYSVDQVDIRRFKREIRIMEGIKHENVINIIGSNIEHNPPFFTMPIAKKSLTDVIPNLKDDIVKVTEVFESICKGINAIHISGHTHRDIKPDNVLLFDDNRIVVSDLGLAKFDERDSTVLTRASIAIGSRDYMSPEQMQYGGTRDFDHRGDVYQLGKTFYHLLTGLNPGIINIQSIPLSFRYAVQKSTRLEPDERYQSVGELLDAVLDARRAMDPSMNPKSVYEQLVSVAEEKLQSNEYDRENVTKLIELIFNTEDKDDIIEFFNKIPERLLPIYSTDLATEFEPVLEKYRKAIDSEVREYPFHFAEIVSGKMKLVYNSAQKSELKKDAILSTLFAAVSLNRFAAMGDFDRMLLSIVEDEDAFAIAGALKDEIGMYGRLYDRIPKKELHPAIKIVWEECERNESN